MWIQSGHTLFKDSGTGKNLYLCRQLVTQKHGTQIAHNRLDGVEAIFCIDIPFGRNQYNLPKNAEYNAEPKTATN